jgi:flagella basal body P-ring formation protein FlgA
MIVELGILLAVSAAPQCALIEKDTITAADLAAVESQFAALPSSATVGHAPAPGRNRVFSLPELKGLAEANGLSFTPTQEVCFTWPVQPLDSGVAEAAMTAAFPEAMIEVLELSRFPVPSGTVLFPRTGLQRVPSEVMLWRGHVAYGAGRRFDIWARVKVKTRQDRVVATELIRSGSIINENQVSLQTYEGPPVEQRYASSLDKVIGRVARTAIMAGLPVRSSDVTIAPEISRGDLVNVEVLNGASRISMEAQASSTARLGEFVELQNQSSGKTFRAKVSGTGRATILLGRTK